MANPNFVPLPNDYFNLISSGAIPGGESNSNHAAGIPSNGGKGGGMVVGGDIDDELKTSLGKGIDIGTGSLGGVLSIFNGNGGVFENSNIFEIFDGPFFALGNISYDDYFKMAKKMGLTLDVSVVKETGADLGVNLSISSSGQGQSQ